MEKTEKKEALSGSSDSEEEIHVYHLRIHDTDKKDAGEWKIKVEDKYGSISSKCNLDVVDPEPKKAEESKPETVSAVSVPDDKKSGKSEKYADDDEEIHVYKMRIHDADLKDAGQWKCEVTDKYGVASTSCNLMVFEIPYIIWLIYEKNVRPYTSKVAKKGNSSEPREAPRFRTSLWNETGEEGESFKLRCLVAGNPRPIIRWYKDGIEIPKQTRYSKLTTRDDGTSILEIISLLASRDSGVYRCEAHSDIGSATTEAKLTVKNGYIGFTRDQYSTREKINDRSDFYFEEIEKASQISRNKKVRTKKKHADAYYESYRNERNSLKSMYAYERDAILKIGVKWDKDQSFYFREHLKNKCVVEGSTVSLNCYVAGIPPFITRWYKDGLALSRTEYEKYFIRSRRGFLSLEIPITTLDDTGEYEVEVRGEQGRIRSQCYIQVEPTFDQKIEYEKPTFLLGIKHTHVKVGQTAVFEASVTGSPTPSVRWYKDGVDLQEDDRVTMHHVRKHQSYVLNIHDADFSDIGLYKCEAHSWAGRASSSAKLIVMEKGADIANFEEEETTSKKIDLLDVAKVEEFRPKKQPVDTVAVVEDMYMAENTATIITKPPIFTTVLPSKMTVDHGDSLFLTVEADGFPRPKVVWMREMRKINPDAEGITITDRGLKINAANYAKHTGTYTASVSNGLKEVQSSCQVLVMAYVHGMSTSTKENAQSLQSSDLIPVEEKVDVTAMEELHRKDLLPADVKHNVTGHEEIHLEVQPSEAQKHRCEETELTENKDLKIPVVSPTGVKCESSPLAKAVKGSELPTSKTSPHFSQPLDAEYHPLERDENVRLQCIVVGNPTPNIVWFKDGEKLVDSKNLKIQFDPVTGISAILLKKLHILDTGDYECFAYSENGCFKTKTTLHIKALEQQQIKTIAHEVIKDKIEPKFITELKDKKTYEGGIIRLDCAVEGLPAPDVMWFKDGERLYPSRGKISITTRDSHHSLVVENFSKSDEGCYSCEASNKCGNSSSSAYLSTEVDTVDSAAPDSSVPVFECKLGNQTVSQGGVAVFKCKVSGHPMPRFKWQKDLIDIAQSNRITINNTPSGESILTISNLTREDAGMYVVTAKNSLGREKMSATLIVDDTETSSKRKTFSEESKFLKDDDNIDKSRQSSEISADEKDGSESKQADDKLSENLEETPQDKTSKENENTESSDAHAVRDHKSDVLKTESLEHFMERKHHGDEVTDGIHLAEEEAKKKDQSNKLGENPEDETKTIRDHKSDVLETESMEHFMKRKHEGDDIADGIHLAEEEAKKKDQSDKQEEKSEVETEHNKRDHKSDVLETESLEHFMKRKHEGDDIADGIHLAEEEAKKGGQSDKIPVTDPQTIEKLEGEKDNVTRDKSDVLKTESKEEAKKGDQSERQDEKLEDKQHVTRDHKSDVLEAESMEHFMKRKHDGDEISDGIMLAEKDNSSESKAKSVQTEGSFDFEVIPEGKSAEPPSNIIPSDKTKDVSANENTTSAKTEEQKPKIVPKKKSDDIDLDELVLNAEETLGEAKRKPSTKDEDISFEDVLAKSVIEESVTEAANEMDKIKSKRKRFTKSKKRSGSVDSSEVEKEGMASPDFDGEEDISKSSITKEENVPKDTGKKSSTDETDTGVERKTKSSLNQSLLTSTIHEEIHSEEGSVMESTVTSEKMETVEAVSTSGATKTTTKAEQPLQRVQHQVSQEEFASAVHDILDIKSLKVNETRETVIQQTTTSGKSQILEVTARRVSKPNVQQTDGLQAEAHGHHHHVHHPPEIILPPNTQYAYEHTEIEITVKVRAARGAKVTWYHDGKKVNFTEGSHYELFEEEFPIESS